MNRKDRRAKRGPKQPLSRAAFERELTKVIDGDPTADPHVRDFFADLRQGLGIEVALPYKDGIEMLSRVPVREDGEDR